MIKDIDELDIYRDSLKLLSDLYDLFVELPSYERDTVDQIRRAAKSIPANIAEGFGKKIYPKEFRRYLMIAMGSSDECVAHLRILFVTAPRFKARISELGARFKVLSKRINKLRSSWISDQLKS